MKVTIDDIADLTPNMRKVLRENSMGVHPRDTYWITIQGMIGRGLLSRARKRRDFHHFTNLGREYKRALSKAI